jgi:hypothetical protein
MDNLKDVRDEDRIDLGDASIETKGQNPGLIPDQHQTKSVAGMSDA